jgi:hypothetical protein
LAVASDLHVLPYEVVVLELYASTPLSNMATPPTYTILIQLLHVIHDVLLTLVIGVFLHPRGEPSVIRAVIFLDWVNSGPP